MPAMRSLLLIVLVAGGYFGWKKYQSGRAAEPAPINDPTRTPGANAANRMDNLSGAAPMP